MRRVPGRSFIDWIEVQLEVVVCLLAVILWIATETPAFQITVLHIVRDGRLNLVVIFAGRLARPLLYVLRIWPFRPVAVRDRFCMLDMAYRA